MPPSSPTPTCWPPCTPCAGPPPWWPVGPIDYRNMGTEELGSVYESLLELVPEVDLPARRFGFVGLTSEGHRHRGGNDRKLTGSYYTPTAWCKSSSAARSTPSLPSAWRKTRAAGGCAAGHPRDRPRLRQRLLSLAAARRLAEKLAQLRAPEGAVTPRPTATPCAKWWAAAFLAWIATPWPSSWRTAPVAGGFEEGRPLAFGPPPAMRRCPAGPDRPASAGTRHCQRRLQNP